MYLFKVWISVKLLQQRTTIAWKPLWKWIKPQIWVSDQLGFSWLGPQLSHEAAFWCFMFGSMAVRSSGALPSVTHGYIWTRGEEVKGEKGCVCVCMGTCTAQPEARSAGGEARQAGSAAQCPRREGSLAAAACRRCSGETLPKWPW